MEKRYKSLRGGSVKTKLPKFQPKRPKQNSNTVEENRKKENWKEEENITYDNNHIIVEEDNT